MQQPIRAELEGDSIARAAGIMVSHSAPVLELCRQLVKAGVDPARSLEAYRGSTLSLRVRSIGEGAKLEVNGEGTGFRQRSQPGTASCVRLNDDGLFDPATHLAGAPVSLGP
jgi:hypothetical protein